ncbi:MAG TPA: hypothetical protein VIB00_00345 [Pyrinomonadaceae bacterium]|jgi:hypothetical protein
MTKELSCPKCDYISTDERIVMCPTHGKRLESKKNLRTRGWVLVFLGGFLVVFMGGLGIVISGIMAGSDNAGNGPRFTGGPEAVLFIVLVFGLVISFGLAAVAGGIWQIIYGRRNTIIMVVMFLFAGLLLLIATAIRGLT